MTKFTAGMAQINHSLASAYGAPATMAKALQSPAAVDTEMSVDGARSISGNEFMAKALAAQAAGHVTGAQVSECEYRINAGIEPDPLVKKAVLTGTPYSPWA